MNKIIKKVIFLISLLLFLINIFYPIINKEEVVLCGEESIPKIYFVGNIEKMESKEDEREISISYVSDSLSFMKFAKIKIQGSSSIRYEKKNYTIKLYDDDKYESKYNVDFGWGEENKYVLKANWIDKTHSRNIVTARIVSSVSEKYNLFSNAPNNGNIDGYPVEVYINGEFLGLYTLNIPKDAWMLGVNEDNPNHVVFDAQINSGKTFFKENPSYGHWALEVGEETEENLDKLKRLYKFISNSSDREFKDNFTKYFNFDSVLNYYVLVDTLFLCDNLGKNMLLLTYDGEIWYTVLYDLDTSFGSGPYGDVLYEYNQNILFHRSELFIRFGEVFKEEIRDRYLELRKDILSIDNILKEIDGFKVPSSSLEKESNRWDNIPGFDTSQMKEYIVKRIEYLDEFYK